jgi:hypothetical protein
MSVSRRFRALVSRLSILRTHFLPNQFSPIGKYSRREYDSARAYVVLVHAEIEAYFEDRAKEIAQRAESKWQTGGRHSNVIRGICSSHTIRDRQPWLPFSKDPKGIASALASYRSLIGSNHGIKEVNVLRLVFPLGIMHQSIDAALLTDLDSFGSSRGMVAHSSIKAQQPIDIEGQFKMVEAIIKRLKFLDRQISRLR